MRLASLTAMMRLLMGSIIAVCLGATSAHADIEIRRLQASGMGFIVCQTAPNCFITIDITGTITDRDAEQLQAISKELEYASGSLVSLDSTGGDVFAAISIGRLFRQYEFPTYIPENAKCYSSCALIFIAGVQRSSAGELGLHRLYFSSAPQNREMLEKQVPRMLSMVKGYIAEMGVTDNFYQQMVNTEPSQMVVYNQNEFTALVPFQDPVFSEIVMARKARAFGVSTAEMRQRTLDAHSCPSLFVVGFKEWSDCTGTIDWGLSKPIYLDRHAKAKRECWFSGEEEFSEQERATIADTPSKLRSDLPLQIRWETCVRNIMQGRDASRQTGWLKSLFGQ